MSSLMRVLQIMATSGGIGGLEQHTFNLCRALNEQGVEVHLLVDHHYLSLQPSLEGIYLHTLDFSKSRWNPILLYQIYKIVQVVQPDLIHVQGGKASKMLSVLLPWLQLPSVATVHGMKNHLKDYRCFDRVIGVSGKVAEKFKNIRQIDVIHNGVDIESILIQSDSTLEPRAIAIGRLDPIKGFDHLIQAWRNIDFQLDIIGEGDERERLQGLIDKNGLQHRVNLLGFKKEIHLELIQSQFLIISSLKEGGPIVLAEALLLDIPVIATDVGMVREFIPTQYIAKTNEIEDLEQLIDYTCNHLDQLKNDFNIAFSEAKNSLTLTAMTNKTIAVYQAII